jgi:hypothetical protein
MTVALMIFDYVYRQVTVSVFPYLKADRGGVSRGVIAAQRVLRPTGDASRG